MLKSRKRPLTPAISEQLKHVKTLDPRTTKEWVEQDLKITHHEWLKNEWEGQTFTTLEYYFPEVMCLTTNHGWNLHVRLKHDNSEDSRGVILPEGLDENIADSICDWEDIVALGWHKTLITLEVRVSKLAVPDGRQIYHHAEIINSCPRLRKLIMESHNVLDGRDQLNTFIGLIFHQFSTVQIELSDHYPSPCHQWILMLLCVQNSYDVTLILDYTHASPGNNNETDPRWIRGVVPHLSWLKELRIINLSKYAECRPPSGDFDPLIYSLKDLPLTEYECSMDFSVAATKTADFLLNIPLRRLAFTHLKSRSNTFAFDVKIWYKWFPDTETLRHSKFGRTCEVLQFKSEDKDEPFRLWSDTIMVLLRCFPNLKRIECLVTVVLEKELKRAIEEHGHIQYLDIHPDEENTHEWRWYMEKRRQDLRDQHKYLLEHSLPVDVSDLRDLVYQYGEFLSI